MLTRRTFLKHAGGLAPAIALPSLLAGCGRGDEQGADVERTPGSTPTATATAGTGSVEVLVGFGTGNAPEQIPPQEELLAAFQQDNPDVEASFLRIPDTDEAQRRLGVLLAAGTPPQVILPSGLFGIALYLDQDVWLDLAPSMRDAGVDLGLFVEPTHRAAKATDYYGEGSDVVVGLPAGLFTHTIAYNKELFAAAGVDEPPHEWDAEGWTYERFLEMATALTRDEQGRTPADAGFDRGSIAQFGLAHYFWEPILGSWGARRYDAESRQITVATDNYIEALQFAADLQNRYGVQATGQTAAALAAGADDPELAAWRSGKIAMIDMCGCDLRSWGADTTFEWDVAAMPRGPEDVVGIMNLDVGAIVAASEEPETAFELLRFMLVEPANARKLAVQSYGAMSPLKTEVDAFVEELSTDFPGVDLQVYVDAIPYSSPGEVWIPNFAQVNDAAGQFLDPVFLGEATAAEMLPQYQQAAQDLVDQWFEENDLPAE